MAEYRKSLRDARKMKKKFDSRIQSALDKKKKPSPQDIDDKKVIASIISDLEYALEWMRSGRNPDARRGIDKRGVYLTDPSVLDVLPVHPFYVELSHASEITHYENEIIEDALCTLTEREKDVFLMIKVEGITFEYTAEILGVKKSTVQTHFKRAEKKIEQRKHESLFLVS
ncbi:positive control sigma-like factor [Bacillus sp. 1NLA3E]|nr:positive control sigma-like factor [Bacillus sp. 1NLA3E]